MNGSNVKSHPVWKEVHASNLERLTKLCFNVLQQFHVVDSIVHLLNAIQHSSKSTQTSDMLFQHQKSHVLVIESTIPGDMHQDSSRSAFLYSYEKGVIQNRRQNGSVLLVNHVLCDLSSFESNFRTVSSGLHLDVFTPKQKSMDDGSGQLHRQK